MAEEGNVAETPTPAQAGSNLNVHKLYVKDLSLECPNAPAIFNENWQPQIDVNVQNTAAKVGDVAFEVVLTVTVTARLGENVAFLIEVQQAGLFELKVDNEDAARFTLGATCPAILYPYAREVVSDLSIRGGFPPILLAPADFEAIYEERLASSSNPS